ncbi:carboxypeptidase-like regulatory domain-containing protein, partial [Proteiniphilum sp. UBA7639]
MGEKQKLSKEPIACRLLLLLMLCVIFSIHLSAQNQKTISGNITDENGVSVIGASVFVKGTTTGTVSDIDGNFSLAVPESSVITISYMGYHPQEISVAGKTNLSIVLKEDNQLLDELVVIGYG